MLYESLKPLVRVGLAWYYRSITVAGASRLPATGPMFLAVNHPNALVDALVVACSVERRVRFTAKATIFSNPLAAKLLTRVGVVPLRRAKDEAAAPGAPVDPSRNAASFDAVADALAEQAAIVIFPEGVSHDAPQLAKLRTGLARMTRMARDERGVQGIRIVPVGLLFEHKEEPRTRVLVQIGEPIDVDAYHGGQASVQALTDAVSARLAAVTLNFETAEDARRIQLVGDTLAALLEPTRAVGEDVVPLSSTLSLVRRIDRVQRALRAIATETNDTTIDARIVAFEQRLVAFRDRLRAVRVDVHDVGINPNLTSGARFAVRELLIAALLLPLVFWGRITHRLPLRLARALALRGGSTSRDQPAMRTLVIGLVLVLLSYALETTLVALLFGGWWALAFFASLIPSASADFRYADRLRRARRRARAYFRFRRDPALQPSLQLDADWLRGEAATLERLTL